MAMLAGGETGALQGGAESEGCEVPGGTSTSASLWALADAAPQGLDTATRAVEVEEHGKYDAPRRQMALQRRRGRHLCTRFARPAQSDRTVRRSAGAGLAQLATPSLASCASGAGGEGGQGGAAEEGGGVGEV